MAVGAVGEAGALGGWGERGAPGGAGGGAGLGEELVCLLEGEREGEVGVPAPAG